MESLIEILIATAVFFTLPWVIFALLSSLTDVGVNYIDEYLLRKFSREEEIGEEEIDAPGQLIMISGLFGIIVSLLATALVWLTPLTFNLTWNSFYYAFAAGMLEVLWLIPHFYAIHRSGALDATPVLQSVPIFALLFGLTLFGEVPSLMHILAVCVIISGAFLLNYSPDLKKLEYRTVGLMLLASAIISFGAFLFKDAAIEANFMTALFGNGLGMGFLTLLIWVGWKPYRDHFIAKMKTYDTKIVVFQTANEGLYTVSAVFGQLAIVFGPSVMLVSAMDAFHPVFTLIVGAILAKLGYSGYDDAFRGVSKFTKIIAIGLIALGTVLIVL